MSRYPGLDADEEAKSERLEARRKALIARTVEELNKKAVQRDTALMARLIREAGKIEKELKEIRECSIAKTEAYQRESPQRAYAEDERELAHAEGYQDGFQAGKAAAISEASEREELEEKGGMGCWGWAIAIGVVLIIIAVAAGGG